MSDQVIIDRIGDRRIIASVSGGKDSAAARLYLREIGVPDEQIDNVAMDTGWEWSGWRAYVEGPLAAALGPIQIISAPRQFEELVRRRRPTRTPMSDLPPTLAATFEGLKLDPMTHDEHNRKVDAAARQVAAHLAEQGAVLARYRKALGDLAYAVEWEGPERIREAREAADDVLSDPLGQRAIESHRALVERLAMATEFETPDGHCIRLEQDGKWRVIIVGERDVLDRPRHDTVNAAFAALAAYRERAAKGGGGR